MISHSSCVLFDHDIKLNSSSWHKKCVVFFFVIGLNRKGCDRTKYLIAESHARVHRKLLQHILLLTATKRVSAKKMYNFACKLALGTRARRLIRRRSIDVIILYLNTSTFLAVWSVWCLLIVSGGLSYCVIKTINGISTCDRA